MSKNKAFTLIELLVVIAIIGILASVVVASVNSAREKGRIGAGKHFEEQIEHIAGELLAGKWDFNDCVTSGTVADLSGNGNNGSLANGATSNSTDTPDGRGCSGSFDGSNDELTISNPNILGLTTTLTISAWIKTSKTPNPAAIYGEFTANGDYTRNYLTTTGGKLVFDQYPSTGGTTLVSNASVNTNAWVFVAYVQNGTARTLYVDGKADATDTAAETYSGPASITARIGFRGSNQPGDAFPGLIDNVRVYGKALVASQIKELYAEGLKTDYAKK